jgi:site-specific recombinase XerD
MGAVKHSVRVVDGVFAVPVRRQPPLVVGYEHFRLDRQGALLSPKTLEYYDETVVPFLRWMEADGVRRFEECDVTRIRSFRADLTTRIGKHGRPLAPKTILEYHRAILCFLRWAQREGYAVDPRILALTPPRVPDKEPAVFHITQMKKILGACNPAVPTEDLVVRILVGSGLRREELCGLAVLGPDGLSDVMTDSLGRGRVELRVRWNAGAKGRKSRRVPITTGLAAAIKRYEARHRSDADLPELLINEHGKPYQGPGIKSMMDRLTKRAGFKIHAHAFRHTFATVATKMGWNFEHLRAAMGHSDYGVLQRYVRLATERDLGPRSDWAELVASNPASDWK